MFKTFTLFMCLWAFNGIAQITISGRILNQANTKPVANASVFLNNATIGDKTAGDGTFVLHNVKPGKFDLVVSIVGFETYNQTIIANADNITLPDILIFPKTIVLKEVSIKPDVNRDRNYEWFKNEFLGTDLAKECKILNPNVLNLDYDEANGKLTAASYDFLEIENAALGYKIKYLLSDFVMDNKDTASKKVFYKGSVLFENLKGAPSQEKRWQKNRQEIYENSEMHFLRSAISNRLDEEGFEVQQLSIYANPLRPSDSLIEAKIKKYKELKPGGINFLDSLSYWVKKSRLSKTFQKLLPFPLKDEEIVQQTDQKGVFALGCNNDELYITYNKNRHFHLNDQPGHLNDRNNTEHTLISFNSPIAFFYNNGVLSNPYSVIFYGVWGKDRVAELLPVDYDVPQSIAVVPVDSTIEKNVTSKLKTFSTDHITEKAYLHFDKPYYASGDTIYFKAYVTLGENHQLSDLSGVLHIDLINTNNKIDQSIELQVTDGVAWGDFALSDSLPKGNYRVRAYTQWMRNNGEAAYFDQIIPVGSVLSNKISESGTGNPVMANTSEDVQFFPEGGKLVCGIKSKIAFKAISTGGLGTDVKGVIIDNENKETAVFTSAHLGMGYFYLTPQEGKTYKAKLTYANGTQNITDLPNAENKGIVLSINNDSLPQASVRIEANKACYQENKNKDYLLVIYSGGVATTVTCMLDSLVISLDILKRHLHTGIATVTLFSPTGEPLSERLLFIQNYDQLDLSINSAKPVYSKREKVSISLDVKDRAGNPSAGHFSVSVIDENKVPVDENAENTIMTNLLLTSDLKGYIEQPNYYFTNITDEARANLDLVMLTHGYRRFEWKPLLNNEYPPVAYQPEKGLEIAGTAKSLGGQPLANATVSLISMHSGQFTSGVADDKGRFRFSDLVFSDSDKFVLQAVNSKGKNSTKLIYDKDKPGPAVAPEISLKIDTVNQSMFAYLENNKKQRDDIARYGDAKGKMLKEVFINDKKIIHYPSNGNLVSPEAADQLVTSEYLDKIGGSLTERILQKFYGRARDVSLVVVDGIAMPRGFSVDVLNASDVETVGALYGANASIYGVRVGQNSVWLITTKRGKGLDPKDIASIGILSISPKGFYKAREFYSPKYDHISATNYRPDHRGTIYWKPELVTDENGNASFEYYNADGEGSYRIVIEGIDNNGNLGHQILRYKVE